MSNRSTRQISKSKKLNTSLYSKRAGLTNESSLKAGRLVNKVLYKWEAPDRIAYKKDAFKTSGVGVLALLIGLYLVWVGQPILALGIVAIFFLYYVITTVPPIKVVHRIESLGIRSMGQLYPWENLVTFWFAELDGHLVLHVTTTLKFPSRLFFIVDDYDKALEIIKILGNFLPYLVLKKKQGFWSQLMEGRYIPPEEILPLEEFDLTKKVVKNLKKKGKNTSTYKTKRQAK